MSTRILAKELILSNNYWALNKTVVRALGIEASLILTVLTEAESMMSDEDGWFFQTIETIEEITTIKRHRQDISIKLLAELGILEQKNKGVPMKRYFRINYDKLANYIVGSQHSTLSDFNKLDSRKSTTSKESTYKESTYKDNTIVEQPKERYDYSSVIDYLNEVTGSNYRNASSHQTHIRARYKEGYTLDDFKQVIDTKNAEWKNDKEYSKYLRPSTLFGNKFDTYLNQVKNNKKETADTIGFF